MIQAKAELFISDLINSVFYTVNSVPSWVSGGIPSYLRLTFFNKLSPTLGPFGKLLCVPLFDAPKLKLHGVISPHSASRSILSFTTRIPLSIFSSAYCVFSPVTKWARPVRSLFRSSPKSCGHPTDLQCYAALLSLSSRASVRCASSTREPLSMIYLQTIRPLRVP